MNLQNVLQLYVKLFFLDSQNKKKWGKKFIQEYKFSVRLRYHLFDKKQITTIEFFSEIDLLRHFLENSQGLCWENLKKFESLQQSKNRSWKFMMNETRTQIIYYLKLISFNFYRIDLILSFIPNENPSLKPWLSSKNFNKII